MTIETRQINGHDHQVIVAEPGKTLRRIHDGFIMGSQIILGIDYSIGEPREDSAAYYEQTDREQ